MVIPKVSLQKTLLYPAGASVWGHCGVVIIGFLFAMC